MAVEDDRPSVTAPGWYDDPWRQCQYRYWDGTAWTANVSGAPLAASGPQAPQRARKSKVGLVVVVLALVSVCGCASLAGLGGKGLSWQAKTERLITSAPADGSSVTTTYSVGVSTELGGLQQVILNALDDRLDHYTVHLEPGYDYFIDGEPSTRDAFFKAAKRKTRASRCEMTYTRRGIQSLNLIP